MLPIVNGGGVWKKEKLQHIHLKRNERRRLRRKMKILTVDKETDLPSPSDSKLCQKQEEKSKKYGVSR
jgi:hypothetical protein